MALMNFPVAIQFEQVSHRVYVSLSKNLSWVLTGGKAGEELERENFVALVKTAAFKNFLDVGANIGLYGFIFASASEGSHITMVEPDKDNAKLISRTIDAVGMSERITLVEAALSDRSGTVAFYRDELTGATGSIERDENAFVRVHHRIKPSQEPVKSVTLDEVCNQKNPDLVKIDVEGAELRVLRGAEKTIERSCPALFFECDENQKNV